MAETRTFFSGNANHQARSPVPRALVCCCDLFLLMAVFTAILVLDQGHSPSWESQFKLGAVFGLVWCFSSFLTGKCSLMFQTGFWRAVAAQTWAAAILALSVSILLVVLGLSGFPRTQVLGTVLVYFLLELGLFGVVYSRLKRSGRIQVEERGESRKRSSLILPLAVLDLLLLLAAFGLVHYFKRGHLELSPAYWNLLQIMLGIWIVVSWLTRKFFKSVLPNFLSSLEVCVKSAFLMAGSLAVLVFALGLFSYSRTQIFGTLLLLLLGLEPILYGLYFAYRSNTKQEQDIESAEDIRSFTALKDYVLSADSPGQGRTPEKPARGSLKAGLELIQPELFDFLDRHLDLKLVDKTRTRLVNTDDYKSLRAMAKDQELCLLLNLHTCNDQRFLNRYFLEVQRILKKGGYFAGKVQTNRNVRARFKRKYSPNLAFVLGLLHFGLHRVLPKLPISKQVYFSLTKGRNRAISKAEVLGRLSFCGFQILAVQDIDEFLHFVVRKTKLPSMVQDPTYGPLVSLRRTGAKGEPIKVYKFRTMHPYSEFLQDYIYAQNKLSPGGKIANDFRVTEWGRILRTLWLDELPMLYNWLRGDLQLIGVRPLSRHFFSLYPKTLQRIRQEHKPGLLPPFYADLPTTFEEICASEEKYLRAYSRAPMRTQVKYFFLTVYNIVVRGARSG